MSNQPPSGPGPWQQQPPSGPQPGPGPAGPPGSQPGPPQYGPPPYGGPPGGGYPPDGFGGAPPRKSKLLPVLAVLGAVVVLAGAGVLLYLLVLSDDDEEAGGDYCALLEENADSFEDVRGGVEGEAAEQTVQLFHELRAAAPAEVADEWAQLDDPFVDLEAALDAEGWTWSDLDAADDFEDLPERIRDAVLTFSRDMGSLDPAIADPITEHAETACGVELPERPAP